jgi:hypothetical protein
MGVGLTKIIVKYFSFFGGFSILYDQIKIKENYQHFKSFDLLLFSIVVFTFNMKLLLFMFLKIILPELNGIDICLEMNEMKKKYFCVVHHLNSQQKKSIVSTFFDLFLVTSTV